MLKCSIMSITLCFGTDHNQEVNTMTLKDSKCKDTHIFIYFQVV